MCGEGEVFELVGLRTRVEVLEQDLSQAMHLLYGALMWVAKSPASEFRDGLLKFFWAKFLQMPQGFPIGRALIDLDVQFGGALQSHGVSLERWVFEPRERPNV